MTKGDHPSPHVMKIRASDTAVVLIDPQNDVLSEKGTSWGAVGASVTENNTEENIEWIFKAAKAEGYDVSISPHYFFPTLRVEPICASFSNRVSRLPW